MAKYSCSIPVLFLQGLILCSLAQEPPVIAVGAFRNVDYKPHYYEHQFAVARDLIVAELAQKYDCRICNRSSGYDASLEHDKKAMASLIQASALSPLVQQADYVVGGWMRAKNAELECVISACNLTDTNSVVREESVVAGSITEMLEKLPRVVARILDLKPKTVRHQREQAEFVTNLVWVVLPFAVHDEARSHQSGLHDYTGFKLLPLEVELTSLAEMALLGDSNKLSLVDHESLAMALQEHEIKWLSEKGSVAGAVLAKLVGADRIMIGSVVSFSDAWRAIVTVVDAHSGLVLGSVVEERKTLNELKNALPGICDELLDTLDQADEFITADSVQRIREAEFYLQQAGISMPPLTQVTPASYGELVVANCQAAYLLSRDDPVMRYRIASYLMDRILRPASWYDYGDRAGFLNPVCYRSLFWDFAPGFSNVEKHRAARIANDMLLGVENNSQTPSPLLQRARLAIYGTRYDEAQKLVEQHQKAYPEQHHKAASILAARSCIGIGDEATARAILDDLAEKGVTTKEIFEMQAMLQKHSDRDEDKLAMLEQPGFRESMFEPEFFEAYIPLLRKVRGPEAALQYMKTVRGYSLGWFSYQAELAVTYQALGQTNEAFAVYETLRQRDDLDGSYPDLSKGLSSEERRVPSFKQMYETYHETKRRTNGDDNFALPADLVQVTNRTLYLLPTTKSDVVFLTHVASNVSAALAMPVKLLPAIPPDPLALDTNADAIKYNACALAEAMVRDAPIPDDAVFVVCSTSYHLTPEYDDPDYDASTDYVPSDYKANVGIASYRIWDNVVPGENIIDYMIRQHSKIICALFVRQVTWQYCEKHPCLLRSMALREMNKTPDRFSNYIRYALCPDCQKHYSHIKIENAYQRYQKYLKQLKNDSSM